ncbi:MAG: UpxY family transcription antiterminator [Bacteroidetes bacterium]|jgi:transcription antitermination factor NusG|nr:MAG: UpxY family transcription antiterminator [Bacteroidota bacterium]
MIPITKKKWYALYTRPRWEKKVADLLEKKKVEVYCPLNKVQKQWADRKKIILEPLFTSYVFVHVTEQEHISIKQTDGVVNFVYWLNKPAVIRHEEIDTIKKFINEYDYVSVEKTQVNLNDRVRIINGPLMMWEGNVVEIRTNTVKITLPSLGRTLVAEIRKDNLETITPLQEAQLKVG